MSKEIAYTIRENQERGRLSGLSERLPDTPFSEIPDLTRQLAQSTRRAYQVSELREKHMAEWGAGLDDITAGEFVSDIVMTAPELLADVLTDPRVKERIRQTIPAAILRRIAGVEENTPRIPEVVENPHEDDTYSREDSLSAREAMTVHLEQFQRRGYMHLNNKKGRLTPIELPHNLQLVVMAKAVQSEEHRQALVREVHQSILDGDKFNKSRRVIAQLKTAFEIPQVDLGYVEYFDDERQIVFAMYRYPLEPIGRLSSMIEYRRPQIPAEKIEGINQKNDMIRDEIKHTWNRDIGKRGYRVFVSDPALKELGYHSFVFKPKGVDGSLIVSIRIDGTEYHFNLDSQYKVVPGNDILSMPLEEDVAWLELITLAHLKKLRCVERENLHNEVVGGAKGVSLIRKQSGGRDQRLRRVKIGQTYTEEADRQYKASTFMSNPEYPKSLAEVNEIRRANFEEKQRRGDEPVDKVYQPFTYQKADEHFNSEAKDPVRVSFTDAAKDIREVVDLDVPSEEELERVTQEIISELESLFAR